MSGCIPWAIAAVSTAAFLVLWMWEVKRLLLTQKSMTDSAAAQLSTCRQRAIQDPCDPEAAQVLHRSESIYRQAVDHYNCVLSRPLGCCPDGCWASVPSALKIKEIERNGKQQL